ncbi:MAG: SPFH domain-containing protein [Cyanobacteria bacterium P01_G01_bin.54]
MKKDRRATPRKAIAPEPKTSDDFRLSSDIEVTSSSPNDNRTSKVFGYVSAYPNEYLIHYRKGKFRKRSSGQGAQCFKLPGDTVVIIPSSLKQIVFQSNQLTVDNVDVRIRGIVIYRIFDPLKINAKINFFNRQAAENKLARMVGDLCRSIVKWLIANMAVEECIRRRKEDIADALKREISLVVDDESNSWGIEIVTIDIQDIYIQDDDIFNALQTSFKSQKMRESELCELEAKRDLEIKQLELDAQLAERRKEQELRKLEIESELAEKRAELKAQKMAQEAELELSKIRTEEEKKTYLKAQELERKKTVNVQELELAKLREQNELERLRAESDFELERSRLEAEAQNRAEQAQIETLRQRMEVENNITPAGLEKSFIEDALPQIATALAKSMTSSNVNIVQGQGDINTPFSLMLFEITELLKERLNRFRQSNDSLEGDSSDRLDDGDN